jgi:predicted dehydrogenase
MRSGSIDAVYNVLPNAMHHDYTMRAAAASIHVLCEKPMADSVAACKEMLDACRRGNVKLMIAYRLHFEEANLKAIEMLKDGKIGEPRLFDGIHTMQVKPDNETRLDADLGAGPVLDVGVYCINAARYLFRAEPTEVSAFAVKSSDPRFAEVPELVSAVMRFPGERLAMFSCGFGQSKVSTYRVVGTKGDLRLEPGFAYSTELNHFLTIEGETEKTRFKKRDQIGPEIVYFSDCILNNREPEPNGEEGLIDLQIIEAIHESYSNGGRPVQLPKLEKRQRPTAEQEITRPAVEEPELINAEPAGQ